MVSGCTGAYLQHQPNFRKIWCHLLCQLNAPRIPRSWVFSKSVVGRFFPKQFTVRGSQCFTEWSPWCWMVWSGSGFPAGLSPTSFHLSPTSFQLSPRLGACSRVSGRLVSHFLAFVSHFFPKQFTVRGSQFFLKMCPRWRCNISIHLSPRSVAGGVRPFLQAMQHSIHLSPRLVTGGVRPFLLFPLLGVRPFPLAM